MCVEVFKPLVKFLRLVDGDWHPSIDSVYWELKEAKNKNIKVCKNVKETYGPITYYIKSKIRAVFTVHCTKLDFLLILIL